MDSLDRPTCGDKYVSETRVDVPYIFSGETEHSTGHSTNNKATPSLAQVSTKLKTRLPLQREHFLNSDEVIVVDIEERWFGRAGVRESIVRG